MRSCTVRLLVLLGLAQAAMGGRFLEMTRSEAGRNGQAPDRPAGLCELDAVNFRGRPRVPLSRLALPFFERWSEGSGALGSTGDRPMQPIAPPANGFEGAMRCSPRPADAVDRRAGAKDAEHARGPRTTVL